MSKYKGMNRRRDDAVDGLIERAARERLPLKAMKLRKGEKVGGRVVDSLNGKVRTRLQELFSLPKALSAVQEMERVVPVLSRYKGQYDRLPDEMKKEMTWEQIETRLLANGGVLLELAERLNERGILFRVKNQEAYFADGGEKEINHNEDMAGIKCNRHGDKLDERGLPIVDDEGRKIPSGYLTFNGSEINGEIFESITGLKASSVKNTGRHEHHGSRGQFRICDGCAYHTGYRRYLKV